MRKETEQKFQACWPEWFRDLYGDFTQTSLHFGFQHRCRFQLMRRIRG
jgi:hypothetical protein